MKKILLSILLIVGIAAVSRAQYVAIPDSNFGAWLNTHGYAGCLTGNSSSGWMMDTSCNKVLTDTIFSANNVLISDLTGICYFKSLKFLDCSSANLISLPYLPNSLTSLYCYNNQLTSLPSLPSSLTILHCYNNQLPSLPSLPSSLILLHCYNNQLTSLPSLPNSLTSLNCSNNQLTSLPSLPSSLILLYCYNNQLTSLPSLPSFLHYFMCDSNQLTSLPSLPSSLDDLRCGFNQLTSLPSLPSSLTRLDCDYNQLTSLPRLPSSLISLNCSNNQLTSLPNLPSYLTFLVCKSNHSLSCLPHCYASNLGLIYIDSTSITCLPNRFTATNFDINPNTLPLCDLMSGCAFYFNIAGDIHNDTSLNCTQDSLYPGSQLRNVKVLLQKNGQVIQQCYTNNTGQYSFKTDSLSSYQVAIDTTGLPFSIACPNTGVRYDTLTSTDTLHINDNFGLRCNYTDYAAISMYANRFRPTFHTHLNIITGNLAQLYNGSNCGNSKAGTVMTILSPSFHYISPAAGALTPSAVTGDTLMYVVNDLNSLTAGSLDVILETDSHALVGSSVCITSIIKSTTPDANVANDTLIQCWQVRNSYDPNLKEVYPLYTVDTGSQWLNYTIQFQNTGNDTAYTVVVRDTLSSSLDASSFQFLDASHKVVLQLFGSAMVFTFPKINLVDSATNKTLSHGWIQYKAKTKSGLTLGTHIKNTAFIYFDLNSPVVTNTVNNTVTNTICVPTQNTITQPICQGDSVLFLGVFYYTLGYYSHTYTASSGCDSVVTLHLTIKPLAYDTITKAICTGDSFKFAGAYYKAAGYYSHSYTGSNSCDSVVTLHLTVNNLPVVSWVQPDTAWCSNGGHTPLLHGGVPSGGHYSGAFVTTDSIVLSGAVDSSFVVEYSYTDGNGCSGVVGHTFRAHICLGISESDINSSIRLYPNPNHGSFTLVTSQLIGNEYVVYDMLGRVVHSGLITSNIQSIVMEDVVAGVYMINLIPSQRGVIPTPNPLKGAMIRMVVM